MKTLCLTVFRADTLSADYCNAIALTGIFSIHTLKTVWACWFSLQSTKTVLNVCRICLLIFLALTPEKLQSESQRFPFSTTARRSTAHLAPG